MLFPPWVSHGVLPSCAASTPRVAEAWEPLLHAPHYDPRDAPLAAKRGATMGMSMTESSSEWSGTRSSYRLWKNPPWGVDVKMNRTRADRDWQIPACSNENSVGGGVIATSERCARNALL